MERSSIQISTDHGVTTACSSRPSIPKRTERTLRHCPKLLGGCDDLFFFREELAMIFASQETPSWNSDDSHAH